MKIIKHLREVWQFWEHS